MTTRREQFAEELRQLLAKYNAELEVRDMSRFSYAPDEEMFVTLMSVCNDEGEIVEDFDDFSIGRWCSGTTVL
jgi:hypothetical protein